MLDAHTHIARRPRGSSQHSSRGKLTGCPPAPRSRRRHPEFTSCSYLHLLRPTNPLLSLSLSRCHDSHADALDGLLLRRRERLGKLDLKVDDEVTADEAAEITDATAGGAPSPPSGGTEPAAPEAPPASPANPIPDKPEEV